MGFKRGFFLFAFLLCAQGAWAATICERFLVQASAVASSKRYDLVQGEPVKLQLGDDPALSDVVFLGRLVTIDGVSRELAFYDSAKKLLHIVPVSKLSIQREGGEALSADKTPPVVRSINQEGGTCAAFSIFNCMRQLHYVLGKKGSEALQKQLDNEQGRTGLLARVV
ncbi:MAG: hypothetical protein HY075_10745 [Deltaproteobacteria bacterium]|nr:hypothetical protein [Deltaproteobacteria bacterium]